jgi:glycosyltransferase involved in cell wall biosynthesis
VNGLGAGGAERQITETIRYLSFRGISVYMIDLHKSKHFNQQVSDKLAASIFRLSRRKIYFPISILRGVLFITKLAPDVIHVQDSFSAIYGIVLAKLTATTFVNGMIRHSGVSKGWKYGLDRILLGLSPVIVSNSEAGLKYYNIKGRVIYNSIDMKRFHRTVSSVRNVVMVANFTDYKDHNTVLSAARYLIDNQMIDKLTFIGDGPKRTMYMDLVKQWGLEDKIFFEGAVHDVESELVKYGTGIMASTKRFSEGISNSVLEYMASGLVVLCSDIGGSKEIIINGVNGFLFEPEGPQSLIDAFVYMLGDKMKISDIKANAIKAVEQKFSMNRNCELLLDVYRDAISRAKKHNE